MTTSSLEAFVPADGGWGMQNDGSAEPQHPYQTLYVRVGINDGNSLSGRAGSPLLFSVVDVEAGKVLWYSKSIHNTGVYDEALISVKAVRSSLRLVVHANGINSCAHAVWVGPLLFFDGPGTYSWLPLRPHARGAPPAPLTIHVPRTDIGPGNGNTQRMRDSGSNRVVFAPKRKQGPSVNEKEVARRENAKRKQARDKRRQKNARAPFSPQQGGAPGESWDSEGGGGREGGGGGEVERREGRSRRRATAEKEEQRQGTSSGIRKNPETTPQQSTAPQAAPQPPPPSQHGPPQRRLLESLPRRQVGIGASPTSSGTKTPGDMKTVSGPRGSSPLAALDSVATFIMGTTNLPKNPWMNWWTRIVPTFKTWGPENKHLYVVMPHSRATLRFLGKHSCEAAPPVPRSIAQRFGLKEPLEYTCPHPWNSGTSGTTSEANASSSFPSTQGGGDTSSGGGIRASRLGSGDGAGNGVSGPVILVTAHPKLNCTDEYHGDGPCCKANFALWYMLTVKRHMLHLPSAHGIDDTSSSHSSSSTSTSTSLTSTTTIKWVAFLDDDVYVRGPAIADVLSQLDHESGVVLVPHEKCFRPPYHKDDPRKRDTDPFPTRCRRFFNDTFWAHPVWLSTGALLRAETGILAGGVRDQCGVLGTSHEAGLGQFLWMYGVGCAPLTAYSARGDLRPGLAVVHRARVKGGELASGTPYEQAPLPSLKMHQVHDYFMDGPGSQDYWGDAFIAGNGAQDTPRNASSLSPPAPAPAPASQRPRLPAPAVGAARWPVGYSLTPHSATHDLTVRWEKLTNDGCIPPAHL